MKPDLQGIPRHFDVGDIRISDYGAVELEPHEMISVRLPDGSECDVTAYDWGLYLAPSLNGRLRDQGFRTALVVNPDGKLFLNAVRDDAIESFEGYVREQDSTVVAWLDEYSLDEVGPGS